jgi:hypothetical protein
VIKEAKNAKRIAEQQLAAAKLELEAAQRHRSVRGSNSKADGNSWKALLQSADRASVPWKGDGGTPGNFSAGEAVAMLVGGDENTPLSLPAGLQRRNPQNSASCDPIISAVPPPSWATV